MTRSTEDEDQPVRRNRLTAADLALVAVFAAVIAALGLPGMFAVPGLSVPITAQTLGVMLAASILGARRGAAAVAVFLVLVAAGLPLLAGGRGGLGVFAGPSAGFLIGWVPAAWVTGRLVELRPARLWQGWLALSLLVGGIAVVYLFGIPVWAWRSHLSIVKAAAESAVFLPGDLLKVAVATVVTSGVFRGYPAIAPPLRAEQGRTVAAE